MLRCVQRCSQRYYTWRLQVLLHCDSYFYPYSEKFTVPVNHFISYYNTDFTENVNDKFWVQLDTAYKIANVFIVEKVSSKMMALKSVIDIDESARSFIENKIKPERLLYHNLSSCKMLTGDESEIVTIEINNVNYYLPSQYYLT